MLQMYPTSSSQIASVGRAVVVAVATSTRQTSTASECDAVHDRFENCLEKVERAYSGALHAVWVLEQLTPNVALTARSPYNRVVTTSHFAQDAPQRCCLDDILPRRPLYAAKLS